MFFNLEPSTHDWNDDPARINRLKEVYRRDRHVKAAHQSTTITNSTSASIKNSLFKNGADDISTEPRPFSEDEQNTSKRNKSS